MATFDFGIKFQSIIKNILNQEEDMKKALEVSAFI